MVMHTLKSSVLLIVNYVVVYTHVNKLWLKILEFPTSVAGPFVLSYVIRDNAYVQHKFGQYYSICRVNVTVVLFHCRHRLSPPSSHSRKKKN